MVDVLHPPEDFPGLTIVQSLDGLFDAGDFKDNENIRLFPAADKLRGDFDAVARRLAVSIPDFNGVLEGDKISNRVGRRMLRGENIVGHWRLLAARYNPFGSMSRSEKQAFDILIHDIRMAESMDLGVLLPIVYSDAVSGHFDVNQHHVDESSSLHRSYNHSATIITERDQVTPKRLPDNDVCFYLTENGQEYPLTVGDYHLMRGVDEVSPFHPLIHRAPAKEQSDTPRIMLSALLG